jgi:hypothetical protein
MAGIQRADRLSQQAVENNQNQERLGLARNADARASSEAADAKRERMFKTFGAMNLAVINEPDEAKARQMFQTIRRVTPDFDKEVGSQGLDLNDYRSVSRVLAARAGVLPDPLERQAKQASIDNMGKQGKMIDAQLGQMKLQTPEYRASMAAQYGIQPGTREYQAFVLMGQLPTKDGESTLDKEVAKTRVEMAQKDIQSGIGAQEFQGLAGQLDRIAKDPSLGAAIGPIQGNATVQSAVNFLPFSQTIGLNNPKLNADIRRLQAQLVLAGGEKMKGLGAQSDADAARLETAVGNLTQARNKQEFEDAITIIRQGVAGAIGRAQSASKQFPQLGAGRINPPAASGAPGVADPLGIR